MGSDKKRKRKESESGLESAERPDKAERKRLKRLKKEKERAEKEEASKITEKKQVKGKSREKVETESKGEQNVVNDGPEGNVSSSVKKKKKTKRKDREAQDVKAAENGSSSAKKKKKKKKKHKEAAKEKELSDGRPDEKVTDWDIVAATEKATFISPLATPIVDDELRTKIFKLLSEAAKGKAIRRGIREVAWSIRRQDTGLCILAADVYPIDVISHFPILCEDANIPYCFVSGRSALGMASLTRRPTSIVMVSMKNAKDAVKDSLEVVAREVKELNGEM
eukprot:GFKZ01008309.1.p2 GENE.GFKZ01008309.1~~GFKZ01008309.1.p2  ORF type:complete len:280 (+),score=79.64 GFKZ01008309.1:352-1191(+)